VSDRYEIGHHLEGLIGFAATRVEAFAAAEKWAASNTGYKDAQRQVRVYDMMARVGQPTKWAMQNGRWTVIGLRLA